MTTDFLDMDGWTTTKRPKAKDKELVVDAIYAPEPSHCPKCGTVSQIARWGTKEMAVRDSPVRGERVSIKVLRRRYKCRSCNGTFLQPLPDVLEDRRMTVRCREFIAEQSLVKQFTHVAADVGSDEKTVRQIAMEHIEALNASYRPYAPRALGIDETKLAGKLRVVLTDLDGRRVIDMIDTYSRLAVYNWLVRLPQRHRIQVVAADMAALFRAALRDGLPGVPVVVDKFHVVKAASGALNSIQVKRKREAKTKTAKKAVFRGRHMLLKRPENLTPQQAFKLDGILKNDPDLADAYNCKEAFYLIWDAKTKAEAAMAIDAWLKSVPQRHEEAFVHAIRAVTEWRTEMLAYWDHRVTNAFTENRNHAAKEINRAGRGYSYDVIRARMLFGKGVPEEELVLCTSCNGSFDRSDVRRFIPASSLRIAGKRPTNMLLLCSSCGVRIHTEEGEFIHGDSTHQSE